MLTKEIDAFYHVFIDQFQALEKELRCNQLANSSRIVEYLSANHSAHGGVRGGSRPLRGKLGQKSQKAKDEAK